MHRHLQRERIPSNGFTLHELFLRRSAPLDPGVSTSAPTWGPPLPTRTGPPIGPSANRVGGDRRLADVRPVSVQPGPARNGVGQHPPERQSQRSDLLQPVPLSRSQPSRTVLQQDQTMPSCGGALRQACGKLPCPLQLASIRLWLAARHESTPWSRCSLGAAPPSAYPRASQVM
jgi:hypothetical protein